MHIEHTQARVRTGLLERAGWLALILGVGVTFGAVGEHKTPEVFGPGVERTVREAMELARPPVVAVTPVERAEPSAVAGIEAGARLAEAGQAGQAGQASQAGQVSQAHQENLAVLAPPAPRGARP